MQPAETVVPTSQILFRTKPSGEEIPPAQYSRLTRTARDSITVDNLCEDKRSEGACLDLRV